MDGTSATTLTLAFCQFFYPIRRLPIFSVKETRFSETLILDCFGTLIININLFEMKYICIADREY